MSTTDASIPDLRQIMREHRGLFLAEGIIFLILGCAAVVFAIFATYILANFIGWMSLVVGVLLFIRGVGLSSTDDRGSIILTGIMFAILGVVVISWPWAAMEGLTLFMAAFCILRGVMDVVGLPHRSSSTAGLQVFSGLCGIALGILLLLWFPYDAAWAPGLLFGIQLFFLGMGTLAIWNALDHPEVSGIPEDRA
ncbi:MAG: DUF308 domain-containing protein [Phycisphaerales bacterium]|nr:DUF308 domain-containing protein [Phycisphaerales bacterium]